MRRQAITALTALAVGGCTATGPLYTPADPPPSGDGILYVYRTTNFDNSAFPASFYLDGKFAFDLDAGGYSYCYVTAGFHTLMQTWPLGSIDPTTPKTQVEFNLRGGGTQYVRFEARGAPVHVYTMSKHSADDALPELSQRHYQPSESCSK